MDEQSDRERSDQRRKELIRGLAEVLTEADEARASHAAIFWADKDNLRAIRYLLIEQNALLRAQSIASALSQG